MAGDGVGRRIEGKFRGKDVYVCADSSQFRMLLRSQPSKEACTGKLEDLEVWKVVGDNLLLQVLQKESRYYYVVEEVNVDEAEAFGERLDELARISGQQARVSNRTSTGASGGGLSSGGTVFAVFFKKARGQHVFDAKSKDGTEVQLCVSESGIRVVKAGEDLFLHKLEDIAGWTSTNDSFIYELHLNASKEKGNAQVSRFGFHTVAGPELCGVLDTLAAELLRIRKLRKLHPDPNADFQYVFAGERGGKKVHLFIGVEGLSVVESEGRKQLQSHPLSDVCSWSAGDGVLSFDVAEEKGLSTYTITMAEAPRALAMLQNCAQKAMDAPDLSRQAARSTPSKSVSKALASKRAFDQKFDAELKDGTYVNILIDHTSVRVWSIKQDALLMEHKMDTLMGWGSSPTTFLYEVNSSSGTERVAFKCKVGDRICEKLDEISEELAAQRAKEHASKVLSTADRATLTGMINQLNARHDREIGEMNDTLSTKDGQIKKLVERVKELQGVIESGAGQEMKEQIVSLRATKEAMGESIEKKNKTISEKDEQIIALKESLRKKDAEIRNMEELTLINNRRTQELNKELQGLRVRYATLEKNTRGNGTSPQTQ